MHYSFDKPPSHLCDEINTHGLESDGIHPRWAVQNADRGEGNAFVKVTMQKKRPPHYSHKVCDKYAHEPTDYDDDDDELDLNDDMDWYQSKRGRYVLNSDELA